MQRKTDPGNRLKVNGVIKEMKRTIRGKTKTQMDIYIEANYVESTEIEWEEVIITDKDEDRIIEYSKDPEVYKKDRKITVGGTFVGIVMKDVDKAPHPFPEIESRQIYLWPQYTQYNYGVAPYWGWGIPYYPIAPYPFNPYPYWSPFWY